MRLARVSAMSPPTQGLPRVLRAASTNRQHRFRNRWRIRALAVVLAVTALLVGAATAAQAHDILVGTSPADGAIESVVPAQVTLTFNEPALAVGTEIIVTGPAGQIQTGAAVLVNNTVIEHLRPGSPAGRYTVTWRVTSTDGHPGSGAFSFTATSASPGQQANTTTSTTSTQSTTAAPAGGSGKSVIQWWALTGGVLILLLLVAFLGHRGQGLDGDVGHDDSHDDDRGGRNPG